MLTIIGNQTDFENFIHSFDWEDCYLKEVCSTSPRYEKNGSTISPSNVGTVMRSLIVMPLNDGPKGIEFVGFNASEIELSFDNEVEPRGTIQRRKADVDFGAVRMTAECIAFRVVAKEALNIGSYFAKDQLFESDGYLAEPYDVDWRSFLDKR